MSEKDPSTSSDKKAEKSPLYIEGLPEALQLDAIDSLREAENLHESDKLLEADWADSEAREKKRQEAYSDFDQMIKDHLKSHGIAEDDEKFDEYANILRYYSVNFIPNREWDLGKVKDDGTLEPSPRLEAFQNLKEQYGKDSEISDEDEEPTEDEDEEEPPEPRKTLEEIREIVDKDPTIKAARAKVTDLRTQLAKLSAKRQGKLWTGKKFKAEYDEVQRNYQDALNKLVKLELEVEKREGLERDEQDERLDVAFKLVQDFKNLQLESVDILKNSRVGKFVTWMTKGGTFKRILKGAVVGVGVGAIGAALSAFTLGVGGGAVAAGVATAAATLSGRFARGFATFDNKDGRGMDVIDNDYLSNSDLIEDSGAEGKKGEETVDLVGEHLMNRFEADTKAEQRKRRKSVAIAMGVVVAGSLVAEGVNLGVDAFTHHIGGAHSLLFGNQDAHAAPSGGVGATTPEVAPPAPVEHIYSPEATTITPGEGWYQTFQDMGIPKQEWSQLLNNTGDQLHGIQVDGHPLAYQMNNGQWGIRMTSNGQMPQSALDIINHAHEQLTGATPSGTSTIDSLTSPVDHGSIANVIHMDTIHPSDIAGNSQLEHLATVAPHLSAETFGQNLGLPRTDWYNLQDYIAQQVTSNNPVYRGVFDVTPSGYVEFATNKIPDNTMADMLNHIPGRIRSNL